jgi:hypothetical protein
MASASDGDQRAAVKRTLSWALVGALCVAALTAIGAILTLRELARTYGD